METQTIDIRAKVKSELKTFNEGDYFLNKLFSSMPLNLPKLIKKHEYGKNLSWETEAVKVIKQKIEHFKQTGNARKLSIYEAKLGQKMSIIGALKNVIKCD